MVTLENDNQNNQETKEEKTPSAHQLIEAFSQLETKEEKSQFLEQKDPQILAEMLDNNLKRQKDAQSQYSKLSAKNATNQKTMEKIGGALKQLQEVSQSIKNEKEASIQRLEGLYHEDPEKWRQETNIIEQQANQSQQQTVEEISKNLENDIAANAEMQRRNTALMNFIGNNKYINTEQEFQHYFDQMPVGTVNALQNGQMTYDNFLGKVAEVIEKAKGNIKPSPDTLSQPRLSDVGDGDKTTGIKTSGGVDPLKFV